MGTSSSLKKGQWVYGYKQPEYIKYKIKKKYTNTLAGSWTKTVYVYKPINPRVSFTYK